ncbi:MAG: N-formylglutamate amidohydrolase [Parvibaculaceae bacterium]
MLQRNHGLVSGSFESHVEIGGNPASGLVILCDHARNVLPPGYGSLGLPASEFERHIAYDIGAEAVTLGLSERLRAPAVLAGFSRLLIDPNRGEDDPTLIMRLSDGTAVPGNADIDEEERQRRIEEFYRPYHGAVAGAIGRAVNAGILPAILSIHSFTPLWKGVPRPWHAGILWKSDPRFARPLLDLLGREPRLVIGDNEPYSGGLEGDTLDMHATRRGLPDALIEIRQDLISEPGGIAEWIDCLARILPAAIERLHATEGRQHG